MPLRIVFMGTPDFAVPTLLEIVGSGHDVVAVYTRAAKPGGRRGLEVIPSPVEREARRFGMPVLTPATLRSEQAEAVVRAHAADVAVLSCRSRSSMALLSAPSICTPRCCRAGAVLRRSSAPSWPATGRPA